MIQCKGRCCFGRCFRYCRPFRDMAGWASIGSDRSDDLVGSDFCSGQRCGHTGSCQVLHWLHPLFVIPHAQMASVERLAGDLAGGSAGTHSTFEARRVRDTACQFLQGPPLLNIATRIVWVALQTPPTVVPQLVRVNASLCSRGPGSGWKMAFLVRVAVSVVLHLGREEYAKKVAAGNQGWASVT